MRKGGLLFLGVLVIGAASVGVAWRWANQPVAGTIQPKAPVAVRSEQTETLALDTEYFQATVMDMTLKRTEPDGPSDALVRLLAGSTQPAAGELLAITVRPLPTGGLNEVSDVMLRQRTPQDYRAVTATEYPWLPAGALAFVGQGNSQISLFWPRAGVYASVVVSGRSDRGEQRLAQMHHIVTSWQWLNAP